MIAAALWWWLCAQPVLEIDGAGPNTAAPVDMHAAHSDEQSTMPVALPQVPGLSLGVNATDSELTRGLQAARLRAGHTVVGGYAQLQLQLTSTGPGDDGAVLAAPTATANVRRMVLFVAHTFTPWLRVYSELEWENAIASRTTAGSAEVEQVFVEWDLLQHDLAARPTTWLSWRAGLLLVPMGILNQWHEPPVFHGTDRARLEQTLIPSTWRELGMGFTGTPWPGLSYEAYLMTGLDASRFSSSGWGAGRTNGSLTDASSWQAVARVEVEPVLGAIVAGSALMGDVGSGVFGRNNYLDGNGQPARPFVPLFMTELDARVRRGGLEARALWVMSWLPAARDLLDVKRADGTPSSVVDGNRAVATRQAGAQLEVAYDVLSLCACTEQQLLPFVRLEYVDLQQQVARGFVADKTQQWKELTLGLSHRPLRTVVLKLDVQLLNRVRGNDEVWGNAGVGVMF
jgi:hypothetical protein